MQGRPRSGRIDMISIRVLKGKRKMPPQRLQCPCGPGSVLEQKLECGQMDFNTKCYVLQFSVPSVFERPGCLTHTAFDKIILRNIILYAWTGQDAEFH